MIAIGWLATAARAACVAITGATVQGPSGPAVGTVVVVDGTITAVGTVSELAGGAYRGAPCTVVPGDGKTLTAGLIAVPTQLGLVEIGLEQASRDDDPQTDDPIRAALVAADAYDPLSTVIPVQRLGGITGAISAPTGGFVAGQAAFVRLHGGTQASAVVDRDAAMAMSLPTSSSADGIRQIRELVADVRLHARTPALYDQGRPYFPGASRLDLEALRPVADGKLPVLIGADRSSDLEALVRLKADLGLDLVVLGGAEAWLVADQLATAKIPVIVDPTAYGPSGFDAIHTRPDNAALLARAGVPLILMSGTETHNVRTLRQAAGNAVREGLSHDDAIRAITETPARVFGQPNRGRIAVGAVADLVLWSGDPLELSTRPERVWIGGDDTELRSRQTELRDKYR
ncbi:MAG: amidohydrolase family protein, partial [Myxococcota bacterium]